MMQVSSKPADAAKASTQEKPGPARLGLSALDRIGNTPLLRLERVTADLPNVEILGKAEWYNPGGSVKDRAASRIVAEAQRAGKLTSLSEAQVVADARAAVEGIRKRANWR